MNHAGSRLGFAGSLVLAVLPVESGLERVLDGESAAGHEEEPAAMRLGHGGSELLHEVGQLDRVQIRSWRAC